MIQNECQGFMVKGDLQMKFNFKWLTTVVGFVLLATLIIPPSVFPGKHPISAWAADNDDSPNCTTTISTENVGNNAIQTAINSASNGDVICIAGGNYPEQLLITKPLTLRGLGDDHNPTHIIPASVSANAVSPDSGKPEAAIILVSSTVNVTLTNLVIDGSVASASINSGCAAPSYEGVLFLGASGALSNSNISNFYQASPSDYGCQDNAGLAILVQTPATKTSAVIIKNNDVTNYQKNGITCNDIGTSCDVTRNIVSPLAAAQPFVASNGIQIGFGAVGTVSKNTVTGNECNLATVCGPNLVTQTQSAGILTFQSGTGTVIKDNKLSHNDIGIATVSDAVKSTNNDLQNNRDEGILLNDGRYVASNNRISGSLIGVALDSDGFVASPTTGNLEGNDFIGTFTTALVQVVTLTVGPYGGTNAEPATLTLNGLSETVTGGTSSNPSIVNITNQGSPDNDH
jgi:hypothetical protein